MNQAQKEHEGGYRVLLRRLIENVGKYPLGPEEGICCRLYLYSGLLWSQVEIIIKRWQQIIRMPREDAFGYNWPPGHTKPRLEYLNKLLNKIDSNEKEKPTPEALAKKS